MSVSDQVIYNLRNVAVKSYPFPHFYIEDCFPKLFYEDLMASLPDQSAYSGKPTKFYGRKFADPTQNPLLTFMQGKEFMFQVATIFIKDFAKRFPSANPEIFHDLRLVQDGNGYQIGPHTDAPWKLVSLLFYLPDDYALERLGTSIYIPKDPSFRCPGGPHHPHANFNRIYTAPFRPNSCFGFWKTDYSFHGVEPITIPCIRNVLLYNLYDREIYKQQHGQ